jgi:large subunit ribosomal protein L30
VKSLFGRNKKHIATANSLGLRKIGDSTVQPNNEQTNGKTTQISYLIKVEEA